MVFSTSLKPHGGAGIFTHKQQIVAVAARQDLFCPPSRSEEQRHNTTKCNPNNRDTQLFLSV